MDIGTIEPVDIDHQMRSAYLDYAMSVIVARALPDARDGLKPVHRRILYAMQDMGIRATGSFKKSARIVGEVLGKYHPHGDLSVYDAMARMAQNFSMRYMMVDGQGNFGSVDGDSPAAMRYTEARLSHLAEEMLADLDKNTVDFTDNFDGTLQEPMVLPARLPNLLLNGSSGIAVGMATNIPPHNLREVIGALNFIIENYDDFDNITVDDLMRFVPGPDFPTGGMIIGREGIRQAYTTGRGRLVVRGIASIQEIRGGRYSIVITEIPYQVNKSALIERMAELVHEGRLDGISDMRDESDRNGMSILIELKRGTQPTKVLNQLFKYTALQSTFGVNTLALVGGEPRHLSLKRSLQVFLDHRIEVITRRSAYELQKARARAHILDGLMIALNNLDDVIKTIRESRDVELARQRLMERFKLSELQAQAILDMQLRRLAALERMKIEQEHKDVLARIAFLEDLLESPKKILSVISADLNEISEKYGDERRTRISIEETEDFREEDLVADEEVLISITQRGYIKRVNLDQYRSRGRGRRGVTGQTKREEDAVLMLTHAHTLNTILFFTSRGKVYSMKVYQIAEANRTDRGAPIINMIPIETSEHITAMLVVPDFNSAANLVMATVQGRIKRASLAEYANVRPSGLIAISLDEKDELGWVRMTSGKDDLILLTARGQALRIHESVVRVMGRQAGGVTGIKMAKNDRLAAVEVVEPGGFLLVVTEKGYGKRTMLDEYTVKGRATHGIRSVSQKGLEFTGPVAAARVVQEKDEITIISGGGMALRLKMSLIPVTGRATRGVHLMDVNTGDAVVSLARIEPGVEVEVEEPGEEN